MSAATKVAELLATDRETLRSELADALDSMGSAVPALLAMRGSEPRATAALDLTLLSMKSASNALMESFEVDSAVTKAERLDAAAGEPS